MGKLRFSPQSVEDLKAIYDYIKRDSPLNASKVVHTIKDECKKLLKYPEIGREIIKTPSHSIRQILIYRYRIFYRLRENDIEVLSIYHSSRLLENNPGLQQFFND
jgi:addiction module RelE/StbE family toxin